MAINTSTEALWRIELRETRGGGDIDYHEDGHTAAFHWRFAGADVMLSLWTDRADVWDERNPWAAGRRLEIMQRVKLELVRQKKLTCRIDCDEGDDAIGVRMSAGEPRTTTTMPTFAPEAATS